MPRASDLESRITIDTKLPWSASLVGAVVDDPEMTDKITSAELGKRTQRSNVAKYVAKVLDITLIDGMTSGNAWQKACYSLCIRYHFRSASHGKPLNVWGAVFGYVSIERQARTSGFRIYFPRSEHI